MPSSQDVATLPLCVDLDGTYLRTDSLHEGFLHILRRRPLHALALLSSLGQGKAIFKRRVTDAADLNCALLPVNEDLVAYLREQKAAGRELALYSAADASLVAEIAAGQNLFDHVEGSDGVVNLVGPAKLAAIRARYGADFVYAGNSTVDLSIWRAARAAIVVSNNTRLAARVAAATPIEARFADVRNGGLPWLQALRPHQWVKNTLLFAPVLLAGPLATITDFAEATLGLVVFSLLASAGYIANDLLDLEADRRHTHKCLRPFAAGRLRIVDGVLVAGFLLLLAAALLAFMPLAFRAVALTYLIGTLSYSLVLKCEPVLDVIALSGLYTIRILAGAILLAEPVSFWLLSFSLFMFMSLAVVKRYTELDEIAKTGGIALLGRGYTVSEIPMLLALGIGTSIAANIIFLIYLIDDKFPSGIYANPYWLWLVFPLLMFWMLRMWRLAVIGRMHEDPVLFALKDRPSLVIGAGVLVLVAIAR